MSVLLGLLSALCWGFHDLLVRLISQRFHILSTLCVVFAISCAGLAGKLVYSSLSIDIPLEVGILTSVSGALFAFSTYALYRAFEIGPIRRVAPIIGSYPVFSVFWAVFTGAQISLMQWIAVTAVLGGVAFVARNMGETEENPERFRQALLWSGVCCFGFAVSFAIGQKAILGGDIWVITFYARLSGFLSVLIIGVLSRSLHRVPLRLLPLLCLLAILDTGAFAFVTSAGHFSNPEYGTVASSISGIFAIILGWIFLKERLTPYQWIAVAAVFGGIAFLGL